MAGDQGTATIDRFERSDLLERVLRASGWKAVVAVVGAIPFVVLTVGSFAVGQPLAIDPGGFPHSQTLFAMILTGLMALIPGVYAVGVAHQIVERPRTVHLGIVGVVALVGTALMLTLAVVTQGYPRSGSAVLALLAISGALMAPYLASPGFPLLASSDHRSFVRIGIGIAGIGVVGAGMLMTSVEMHRSIPLWNKVGVVVLIVHAGFLAASWLAEGFGYEIARPKDLWRRTDRLRERIDTAYGEGSATAEERDRWRDRLTGLKDDLDTALQEQTVVERLDRHGQLLMSAGIAFGLLAVVLWFLGMTLDLGSTSNAVWDRRLTLGWFGSLTIGFAISLPLLGVVSLSAARLQTSDRSDILGTADERVADLREEVLETVRTRRVEEE